MILGIPVSTEDDRDDKPRKSRYVSWKEVTVILVVILLLLWMLKPAFDQQALGAQETACKERLKAIGVAVSSYAADHDDRLPPTYYASIDGSPAVDKDGLPRTWASEVSDRMDERHDFVCPSAKPAEFTVQSSNVAKATSLRSAYGMYRGLSSVQLIQIPNPSEVVMVAETANLGALGSFDPQPFGGGEADGFLIAWDNHNLEFSRSTKSVTRLAFRDNPDKSVGGRLGRHRDRVLAITVEGGLHPLIESDTKVQHAAPRLKGMWWADPNLYR